MDQSIVCGIDNSEMSQSAAWVAARLARETGHRLVLAHVADDPPAFPYGDTRLRELQRRDAIQDATAMLQRVAATLPGIVPETRVLFGDAVEALTLSSRRQETELLVVGSRGRGPLAAAILGSVSAGLASAAQCPVVVVSSTPTFQRFPARRPSGAPVPAVVVVPPTARITRLAENAAASTVQDVLRATADRTQQAVVNGPRRLKPTVEHQRTGRFSEGLAQLPETPSKLRHGRFSDGLESLPTTPDMLHRGRFSRGIECLPHPAATLRRGSFADGFGDDVSAPRSKAA
jgi:nucleotide-binding universal stress UspA family protein